LPTATPRVPRKSSRAAGRTAAEPPGEDVDAETLARLKQWRTDEARRQGVPPYVVFHDRTLVQLAATRPRALEDLRRVPGIGPAKLERYGEALLALLSAA
jgi:ATP-dependent DNA helicase RecQ